MSYAIQVEAPTRARRSLGLLFWLCVGWIAVVVLAAVLAPVLSIPSPTAQSPDILAGPSVHHLLGTDELGRDELSRLIYGARVSLVVGVLSVLIGLLVGGFFGLLAGFLGGWVDQILNSVANLVLAFPALVLLLAVVSVAGPHLFYIVAMLAFLGAPIFFRIVRGAALTAASQDYVAAARVIGATPLRIVISEIVPNIAPPIASLALLGVAATIIVESGLSFLGLSVRLPTPSWGNMIAEGASNYLVSDPSLTIWPSAAIVLTTVAFNWAGSALLQFLDARRGRL